MKKIAIIGLGVRMELLLEAFRKVAPGGFEVVGLIDQEADRVKGKLLDSEKKNLRVFKTVDQMMKTARPDGVMVGTRCNTHTDFACALEKYGVPIYLEKPVSTTMKDALRLEKAFHRSKTPVLVSFPLRVSPLFQKMKEKLRGGAAGRIEHVLAVNYVTYGDVYFQKGYRNFPVTRGLFLQKATHDFDYLMQLVGSSIVRVAAMKTCGRHYRDSKLSAKKRDSESAYFEEIGTPKTGMNEDSSSALLEFENGVKGVYTQVFFIKNGAGTRGATIAGNKATLTFDWYTNKIRQWNHLESYQEEGTVPVLGAHAGGDEVLLKNFYDLTCGKGKSLAPIQAGLQSVYACLAAQESSEKGVFKMVHQNGYRYQ